MIDGFAEMLSLSISFILVGLGVYLSAHILKVTDLTCEASIGIGGCCYGAMVLGGIHPIIAVLVSGWAGAIAGLVTASLARHIKIGVTLASVATIAMFHTFIGRLENFISLSGIQEKQQAANYFCPSVTLLATAILVLLLFFLFYRIINSEYGLAMRVYGDGEVVSESLGIESHSMLCIGLCVANLLIAVTGALIAQISGNFSASMGNGVLIFGLGVAILSRRMAGSCSVKKALFVCSIAAFLYKLTIEIIMLTIDGRLISEYEGISVAITFIFLCALFGGNGEKSNETRVD